MSDANAAVITGGQIFLYRWVEPLHNDVSAENSGDPAGGKVTNTKRSVSAQRKYDDKNYDLHRGRNRASEER